MFSKPLSSCFVLKLACFSLPQGKPSGANILSDVGVPCNQNAPCQNASSIKFGNLSHFLQQCVSSVEDNLSCISFEMNNESVR